MKVALLSADFPPASTEGVARSTETLARGLVELGHQVHVVTLGDREADSCCDVGYVHRIAPRMRRRYEALAQRGLPNVAARLRFSHQASEKVQRLVSNHGIDVVDSPLWGFDGLVSVESGTCPVVVRAVTAMRQIATIHRQVSDENTVMGELEEELLARCALIVSNSEATRTKITDTYPQSQGRPHRVVPYGIVPGPEPGWDDVSDRPARILFVGRLETRKGIRELFEAIPSVLTQCPGAVFEIAGSDNSRHDGHYAEHGVTYPEWFRRRHPDLSDRVRFLGHIDDDELPRLYRSADLFVGPSRFESFGLVYLEAMDAGLPVIACAAGGPTEIVQDGETGRLVPPEDADSLANALIELAGDPSLRRRMGRAGRARMLDQFTHLKMAEGFVEAYGSLR